MSAEEVIAQYVEAGEKYARLVADEMALADRRPVEKRAAVLRLMEQTNPLTNKVHSASSAEAVVETDEDYREFRETERGTVAEKNTAYTAMIAARLRAELAISLIREGVSQ